jgi:hypothetical protein
MHLHLQISKAFADQKRPTSIRKGGGTADKPGFHSSFPPFPQHFPQPGQTPSNPLEF